MHRLIGPVAVLLVGLFVAASYGSAGSYRPDGEPSDALFDWLVVQAVVGEGTPFDPKGDLNTLHLGADAFGNEATHPRTPGALLLQMPLTLVPASWALPLYQMLAAVSVAVVAGVAGRLLDLDPPWIAAGAFAYLLGPVRWGLGVGSQAPIVAALIAISWVAAKTNRPAGGIALGVASTLKAFPLLLIAMLWVSGNRRTSYGAAATFAALNLTGLLLPDVTINGAISTMTVDRSGLAGNVTGFPLWMSAVIVTAAIVWAKGREVNAVATVGSAAMLLASPIVWHHYLVVLLLPLVAVARSKAWPAVLLIAALWTFPPNGLELRSTVFLGTVGLVAAAGLWTYGRQIGMPYILEYSPNR